LATDRDAGHYFDFFTSPPSCNEPISYEPKCGGYVSMLRLFFCVPHNAPILLALRFLFRLWAKRGKGKNPLNFFIGAANLPSFVYRRSECAVGDGSM
jgi:hypothetical protein